jgi:CRP-like cAMP-binding protein
MPSSLNFKTKSVIYFQGDRTSHFYLLRRGSIELTSTVGNTHEIVLPGFFFGTQSTLIGKPQGQTAMATLPSEILSFDYQEFITLLQNNSDLRSSLLTTFISQLSDHHTQLQRLMSDTSAKEEVNTSFEHVLIKTANFFLKNRAYQQAHMSYKTYIARFPKGEFFETAQEKIFYCEQKEGGPDDLSVKLYLTLSEQAVTRTQELSPMQVEYEELQVLLGQKKHSQALIRISRLLRMDSDPAYKSLITACRYTLGETLIQMDKFHEAIEPLTSFISDYNDHDDVDRARLYLGIAYENSNKWDNAIHIYTMLVESLSAKHPLGVKAKKLLEGVIKKKDAAK